MRTTQQKQNSNGATRSSAEHGAFSRRPPTASWEALLRQAITTPGMIHEAYQRFHQYSLRNQLLAMAQCAQRGINPGPIATFKQWEALGRHVLRGEKALVLCVPVTPKTKEPPADEDVADAAAKEERVFFTFRARWFVLSQTDGEPYEPLNVPTWDEARALTTLGISTVPFDHLDGNVQGYATAEGSIAINPVAAIPHKTLFHEAAHVLLGHAKDETISRSLREVEAEGVALLCCEALGLDGAEYARGYLQHWLRTEEIPEQSAQRIITTAHRILEAGNQDTGSADAPRAVTKWRRMTR
jgi:antirestriction protein ArdC